MAMANVGNLIPEAHKLTVEEQSAGGKASGRARAEKKTMREVAKMILSLQNTDPNYSEIMDEMGIEKTEQTNRAMVISALTKSIKDKGDSNAAKVLMQTAQEFSEQQEVDLSTKQSVFIKGFCLPEDSELDNIGDE